MTAQEVLEHYDRGSYWTEDSGLEMPVAYECALAVRQLRIARGEQPRGYKIGFTNRGIWPRYNLLGPSWGTVWDTTLTFCEGQGEVSLAKTLQPRLEPVAVLCFSRAPPANASRDQLLACLEWVAPGAEIVQSHQAGWKFAAADTVADGGLHARLLVGTRVPVAAVAKDATSFEERLAGCRVALHLRSQQVDEGMGANALDGPLHALQHFLHVLRTVPGAPEVRPGDVVTSGTWTDAWPVAAGELWVAQFEAPLSRLEIVFT
jgi:2-oxo-3-hexenedioate decarboxylase